jgi:ABC-type nitrate/sulfonate/bicarbonate transport system ATPase subunit
MSIIIKNLSFSYPDKQIFSDFSKEFSDGIFYSITAPSGKGKTTLFRLISGLEKSSEGSIEVTGHLAYMFQEDRLFPNLTVLENARLAQSGEFSPEEILDELGLLSEKDAYPNELSGGMKRRVALARTLLAPSQNIILDEPFTGLDDITKLRAISLITRVCHGKTLLISTHDEAERTFCNEDIVL